MPQQEREENLQIVTDPRDGTQNVCLNPRKLSLPVIRQMLTSQINDKDSKVSVIIEARDGTVHIPAKRILEIREFPPEQQESFIEAYTDVIGYADRVIFLGCEN